MLSSAFNAARLRELARGASGVVGGGVGVGRGGGGVLVLEGDAELGELGHDVGLNGGEFGVLDGEGVVGEKVVGGKGGAEVGNALELGLEKRVVVHGWWVVGRV